MLASPSAQRATFISEKLVVLLLSVFKEKVYLIFNH